MVASGDRPSPTEAVAETLSPFESATQGKLPTPCPLPRLYFLKEGTALAREGEYYSIHLISKGLCPFGTPGKGREEVRRNREEVKLPQSPKGDSPLGEGVSERQWRSGANRPSR